MYVCMYVCVCVCVYVCMYACVCVCYVCMYVCVCAVSIRPLVIINKSIYEMCTFIHLLRRQLLACGIMLPAAFQGAPRSQPSEIMLSEWVSHSPQRVRAAAGCAWWCAGQCARKRRTTEAPPGFCPFFLQQWTKPGLVFFLPVVIISLFFSSVRSVLSTSGSFSLLFLCHSVFVFCIAVL